MQQTLQEKGSEPVFPGERRGGGDSLPRLIRSTTAKVKSLVQMTLLQGAAVELLPQSDINKVALKIDKPLNSES